MRLLTVTASVVAILAGFFRIWAVVGNPRKWCERGWYCLTRCFHRKTVPIVWAKPSNPMDEDRFRRALMSRAFVIGQPRQPPHPPKGTPYPWLISERDYEKAGEQHLINVVGKGKARMFLDSKPLVPRSGEGRGRWSKKCNCRYNSRATLRLIKNYHRKLQAKEPNDWRKHVH